MIPNDFKKLLDESLKPIKEDLNGVKEDLGEVKKDLGRVKEDLAGVKKDIIGIKETQEDHTSRLEALSGDVYDLKDQTKAIWDKIGMGHDRNKREIDEIKSRLRMPLMPDIPQV